MSPSHACFCFNCLMEEVSATSCYNSLLQQYSSFQHQRGNEEFKFQNWHHTEEFLKTHVRGPQPSFFLLLRRTELRQVPQGMRHQFRHENQVVYEWEQTLSDLNIFIKVPTGIKAKQLYVDISNKHLRVGIVPNPPYLEVCLLESLMSLCKSPLMLP